MKYISKKLFAFPVLALLIAAVTYGKLPNEIPIHFDFYGNPDNYSSKLFIFVIPIIMAAVLLLADFLPKVDPKSSYYEKFPKAYQITHILLQILLLVVQLSTIVYTLKQEGILTIFVEGSFNISYIVCALLGITFIILGNYMPKFKQNFFCGIKTPWTLTDEENWYKTHRLTGKLWVLGGILMIFIPYFPGKVSAALLIVCSLIMVLAPMLYSYLLVRQKTK